MIIFLDWMLHMSPLIENLLIMKLVGVAYAMIIGGLETTQYAIAHQAQMLVDDPELYIEDKQ